MPKQPGYLKKALRNVFLKLGQFTLFSSPFKGAICYMICSIVGDRYEAPSSVVSLNSLNFIECPLLFALAIFSWNIFEKLGQDGIVGE